MRQIIYQSIKAVILRHPEAVDYLDGSARNIADVFLSPEVKSFEFFLKTLRSSVRKVYNGDMGGEFIDILADLLQGQLTRAWDEGLKEAGYEPDEASDAERDRLILREYDFVDGFYRAIIDARVDQTPLDPLLARAEIWANRYDDVRNQAIIWATPEQDDEGSPQMMVWHYNPEKEHCDQCASLNGIIASLSEWRVSGYHPYADWDGNLPNEYLGCGGWRCGCELLPTGEPRNVPDNISLIDYIAQRIPPVE